MKPYGGRYDSKKMKKDPWHGVPGAGEGTSPKKAARQSAKKRIKEENMENSAAARVHEIIVGCLYNDAELPKDGSAPPGAVIVQGVVGQFGFHPERLKAAQPKVEAVIREVVQDPFLASKSGGMSFLNLCEDRQGQQWAEHRTMDELVCLSIGLKLATFPLPRYYWGTLPGGVPYVTFRNLHP